MLKTHPVHIGSSVDNGTFASPIELARQSAYFADVFMTRHLLDAMPGMVLVLNCHRQIVFANRAFYQISGRSASESLIGKLIGNVLSCHVAGNSEGGCGTGESCQTCGALVAMLFGLSGDESVQ